MEGVLVDIHRYWIEQMNKEFNTNASLENIDQWYFESKEYEWLNWRKFLEDTSKYWKERWMEIFPTENNLSKKISRIKKLGYEVSIVTNRNGYKNEMQAWLSYHEIPYDNFISLSESKSKVYLKDSENFEIVIDDNPNLIQELRDSNLLVLVYDRPWNKCIEEKENVKRVKNLNEAIDLLENLIKEI